MSDLLVVAHGSHRNPDSARPAYAHARTIRETGVFDTVQTAFWKEEPHLREALRTLPGQTVYVVPLFVSQGYFTEEVIPRELRLDGWTPELWDDDGLTANAVTTTARDTGQTVHYCGPVGTHPAMTDVIIQRAQSVTGDSDVGPDMGLAVVGHGTKRNANSAKAIQYHADRVRTRERFAEVRALFLDEDPAVERLPDLFDTDAVVVVPLFIADGYHTREDIPQDLGIAGEELPARTGGIDIWYAGAVGTEPLTARVILARVRDAGGLVPDNLFGEKRLSVLYAVADCWSLESTAPSIRTKP